MAVKSMLAAVFLLLAVVAPPQRAAAATYIVGESLEWSIPFHDYNAYSKWASTKTFDVGDILVFNFWTGTHDVTEVTKAAFDSCWSFDPIASEKTGPARITLSTAGTHYFICSHHCTFDQKLAVTVQPQPSPPPPRSAHSPVASSPAGFSPSPSIKPKTPLSLPPRWAHFPVASAPAAAPLQPISDNSLPGFSPSSSIKPETPLSPPPHSAHSPVASPPAATSPPTPNSGDSLRGFSHFFSAGLAIVALLL